MSWYRICSWGLYRIYIDIVLFLNDIPVVSMELKDQFTGNAINQYKFDRTGNEAIYYMTYTMYYGIVKNILDDPQLDTTAGLKAIRNFASLHPHNISQKTTIMLEHLHNVTNTVLAVEQKQWWLRRLDCMLSDICWNLSGKLKKKNIQIWMCLLRFPVKYEIMRKRIRKKK